MQKKRDKLQYLLSPTPAIHVYGVFYPIISIIVYLCILIYVYVKAPYTNPFYKYASFNLCPLFDLILKSTSSAFVVQAVPSSEHWLLCHS